jgi:hypothetical protein
MADNHLAIQFRVNYPECSLNKPRQMTSVLASWKDIADYLGGKGIRTVQRWEKDLGLPVRRSKQSGKKSNVLSVPAEIDLWVRSQKFAAGQSDSVKSQQSTLVQTLKMLRSENRPLRLEITRSSAN